MKYTLFALSLVVLFSCNKSEDPKSSSPTTPPASLNTMETSLTGVWYLDKITDSTEWVKSTPEKTGQSYGPYTNNNYLDLKNISYSNGSTGNEKECYDAVGVKYKQHYGFHNIQKGDTWWYFDSTANKLIIQEGQYSIVEITSNKLTLKSEVIYSTDPNMKKQWKTFYLHK